jgi:cobalt-zinc-cadmium efflux system protein
LEIVGGIFTNSMAILSDALHDLGDSIALALSWYFEKISHKGRSKDYSYGYRRFSVLGAVTTSSILVVGSIVIIYNAIPRLINPEETHATGMVLFALVGILANGLAFVRLSGGESLNERAVKLHLLEDLMGWVAVLVGSIIIYFTHWYIIDPILSLMIAIYIFLRTIKNFKKAIQVFLQAVPDKILIEDIENALKALPNIESIHDVHVWSIDGEINVLTVHMVITKESTQDFFAIKEDARMIMEQMDVGHCTLELEWSGEPCPMMNHED